MFFFPYATDAPIYYLPIVTVLLIAFNTVIFFATGMGAENSLAEALILHGSHINPVEWITCNFMHAGFWHLIGNMLFLWPFGLVVEGKLGWFRFLAVYFGICLAYGAALQGTLYAFGSHARVLGASAAIFGLIGLALVWAPRNEFKIFYVFLVGLVYRAGIYEMTIIAFSMCFVAWEVVLYSFTVMFVGFHVSSEALHLIGFGVGFPLGLLMLKLKWVDCEGWDLLSTWATGTPARPDEAALREEVGELAKKFAQKEAVDAQRERTAALDLLHSHLVEHRDRAAYAIYQKHAGADGRGWTLPEPFLVGLIDALRRERMWTESIPLLRELIERCPEHAAAARLKLAHILIEAEHRPRQALSVLTKLPPDLPEPQKVRCGQLQSLAQRAIDEGEMEVSIEDW